jgi:hypothetical protein
VTNLGPELVKLAYDRGYDYRRPSSRPDVEESTPMFRVTLVRSVRTDHMQRWASLPSGSDAVHEALERGSSARNSILRYLLPVGVG